MSRIFAAAVALLVAGVVSAVAQVPQGYPADYAKIVEAANREGKLVVYSTTDSASAAQLLRDFAILFPLVRVDYVELNSGELYKRFLSEVAAGADTADALVPNLLDVELMMRTLAEL